ncbi:MAG: aldo/keto reductase [Myxococcales bacterium]|nr:aldo/keto reductase [Myxococcales bacterium]
MKKRKLGTTEIYVTEIGLGTNAVGGHNLYDNLSEERGVALVRRAVELGVNFIDTADIYGLGRSEELVGQALQGRRGEVVLATKGASEWDAAGRRVGVNNRPEYLRRALEASLRRLGTDYVDLYYLHRIDGAVPLCDSFGELQKLKAEGKIRAVGLSNVTVPQLQAAMCAGTIDAVQNEYSLFQREAEEDVLPFCEDNDISFIPYGPLAYGLLAGRYDRGFRLTPNDWRHRVPFFDAKNFGKLLDRVDDLKEIAATLHHSLPHLAIRWALRHRMVSSVIAGAKNPDQVDDNAAAVDWDLTDAEIDAVDEVTADLHYS